MKPAGTGAVVADVGRLEVGGPPQADTTTAAARSAPSACECTDLRLGTPPLNVVSRGGARAATFLALRPCTNQSRSPITNQVVGDVGAGRKQQRPLAGSRWIGTRPRVAPNTVCFRTAH